MHFTLPVTKRIVRDTLLALQYIHSTGRTHVGLVPVSDDDIVPTPGIAH